MGKRENAKSSVIRRIRKPLKVTIDPENHEYLKEIGVNASRLLDKAIYELRKVSHHGLVLISQKKEELWARPDLNRRSSPCEGDVMTRPVSGFSPQTCSDDFSRTLRESETDRSQEGITTFNEFYETHREGFEKWLDRRVREGDLSDRSRKDYLSAVDRYLIEEADDDIIKPADFRNMSGDKQTRGVKNFFNYLEEIEIENPLGYPLDKWRKNVKIQKSGVVEIYPSNREIVEAYNACPPEYRTFFKALVYTGNRFSQLYAALQNFNPQEVTIIGDVAHLPSASLSSGTKRSYRLFFPAAFIPELSKISLQSEDNIKKGIQHGRVSAKTIRKWNLNFLVENGVSESIADFMQGRAPVTVGSAHYLNKIKQSVDAYQKVVEHFPIPPAAGEKIPLPAGTKTPTPRPQPAPTPKKENPKPTPAPKKKSPRRKPDTSKQYPPLKTTGKDLQKLWLDHESGFSAWCLKKGKGIIKKPDQEPYIEYAVKINGFFRKVNRPVEMPADTASAGKKEVTALRLFLFDYLPEKGITKPLGYTGDQWREYVNYSGKS